MRGLWVLIESTVDLFVLQFPWLFKQVFSRALRPSVVEEPFSAAQRYQPQPTMCATQDSAEQSSVLLQAYARGQA